LCRLWLLMLILALHGVCGTWYLNL
jgi:hypothetical protein